KYIFGDNGENVELGANWIGGELLNIFTLKPKSQVFAENIEYYNLVEMINPKLEQGDIILNKSYTLYERRIFYKKLIFSSDTKFKNLQIAGIKFSMGQSTERKYVASTFHTPEFSLNSDFPFLHFDTGVESEIAIKPANLPQLSIEITTSGTIDMINNNLPNIPGIEVPKITFEVAFDKKDGRVICKCWIKITTNKGAEVDNLCNTMARGYILQRANNFLSGLMEEIFDNLLGDVLDITTTRWNKASDAMEIEYIADVLSERKPNSKYQHVIGRATQSIIQNRNSWVSEELTKDPNKIKHIVVLMMENRSFDHVLGYLSLPNANTSCAEDENDNTFSSPAINPEVNGLAPNIIEEFSDNEKRIRHLKCAKFKESTTTDTGKIRTKIPIGVGHNYTDALEQINKGSMKGFVKNFKKFQ